MRMAARCFSHRRRSAAFSDPPRRRNSRRRSLPLFAENLQQPKPQEPSIWSELLCRQRGFRDIRKRR